MSREFILVSRVESDQLFKSPKAHIDNNPLIISRYNPKSGKRIDTKIGNDLTKLVSIDHADYYFVQDRSVHAHTQLDPADITHFVLANSHKGLNRFCHTGIAQGIQYLLFDFIMENVHDNLHGRKIKSFF